MKIEFDRTKSERNARDRGLSFGLVEDFDFDSALIVTDARRDYGETRYRAIGRLNERVVAMVFTLRGDVLRVISLRLASRKERRIYEKAKEE
ncbi:MAG: BrnT family toxin [Alphaproteobacteria bacterium]|nr:BrnT family toxin [Alphaproteobacteria bacterium]MBN9566571.1 BrnT family toxin [Alphaproteobacteria bacterium]MBN9577317.1 BrnT family toxin [Alphaproteobacteria bacterium]MBN9593326.1 BrnT family toxin [Alphaproteobacteria bacterium]